jgi:thioesterase domain-containing protein/acyl carrier protein
MDHLPLHMVPAQLIPIDTLPLTPSGKLDHTKLPEPEPAETRAYTPPSGATQRALAELWAQLLDVPLDRIGAHDDFFDLGGNSLQVTRLISRIHDTFKISVTPRELFVHSVLRELARRIDDEPDVPAPRTAAAGQGSPLVPIRATGSRPPLFLVHAVGGSIAPYVPLARNLDPRIPVYGLEHVGLGGARPAASGADPGLTAIAESYLGAVRDVWPAGPYHLGGWSLGGAVALEMAALLRADGEEVSLLALFDTGVPPMAVHPPDDAELLTAFARDLAGLEGTEPPALDPDRLRRMPAGSRIDTVLAAVEEAGLIPAGTSGEVRSRVDIFLANARAYHTYRPTPYGGRITLFSAEAEHDDQLGWWRVFATGGLGHHVVPGTHHTMLRHPNLPVLARALQRCLDDGQDHDREQ